MALAELFSGMARELQAAGDIHAAAGYVSGSPVPAAPYQPPQLG